MASGVKSKIEGKLDALPDEGWQDDETATNAIADAVEMVRIRAQELKDASARADKADSESTAAWADKTDRQAALEDAQKALLKAATA